MSIGPISGTFNWIKSYAISKTSKGEAARKKPGSDDSGEAIEYSEKKKAEASVSGLEEGKGEKIDIHM